jgi:hypothetical protein
LPFGCANPMPNRYFSEDHFWLVMEVFSTEEIGMSQLLV